MKRGVSVTVVILVIIAIVALIVFGSYNSLVSADEDVNNKWSQIDNQLQRRADLIPNLVETVKGYAAHEKSVFAEVTKAREKLIGASGVAQKAEASEELSGALSRLLAIAENYPDLKADANFRQLQDELAGTENRIAVARMDYNNAVQAYNSKIRKFPTVIIANMFGFEKKPYFKAEEGTRQAPEVNFKEDDN
ncbi:MAG TPA: LemA family protein [Thermoanaerobacterales bacterium]|jgi:LemA protein|nr:LemA family protein [Thermoanaerobacterales bacterium]